MTVQLSPDARLVEVDGGAVLLRCDVPAAAWVSPAALEWTRGVPVPPGRAAEYARCLDAWRAAGLVRGPDLQDEPAPADREGAGADRVSASHPVLVVASSPECGYCRQLRSDLDANRHTLTHSGASVLLLGEGRPLTWGAALETAQAEELAATYAHLGRLMGTPSAVRLSPGGDRRVVRGFEAVTAALIELSGSEPGRVVCEVPTSCSVEVNGAPVDALVIARAAGKVVGIAARGEAAVRMATLAAEGTQATDTVRGYVPVTLLVERPRNLWLVFRGGELAARSRGANETLDALGRIIAGFEPPGARQVRLMCGALVESGGGRALLFPRNWMSYLVERNSSLARAGWRLRPDPFACLEPGPDGAPLLSHPSRTAGYPPHTRVAGVLTPRPTALMPGPSTRARLLTQIVNWAVRPVPPEHIRTVCAWVADLPLHLGTQEEVLAFLTRSPDAE